MTLLADPAPVTVLLGALVGIAGSTLGCFLVLRGVSMLSDAISHSILLGIVVAFLLAGSATSPLLLVGASLAGVLTVLLTEGLARTKLVKDDAAIGLVFPAMFALAVVLAGVYARNVHIDAHTVLLGEIGFAWLDVVEIGGVSVARSLVVMAVIALVNVGFVALLYKELKVTTFDPALARALGFAPGVLQFALLALTSVTAVGAFDSVGVILFVAFVIAPAAAAYLLTDRLAPMLLWSAAVSIVSSGVGYELAVRWDVNIGGMMASVAGACLAAAFVFGPKHGVLRQTLVRRGQRSRNDARMLVVHLYNHDAKRNGGRHGGNERHVSAENAVAALEEHLHWNAARANRVVKDALERNLVVVHEDGLHLLLTEDGRAAAREVLEPWRRPAHAPG